ncbi:ATP-dependent endonuclease [Flavivirga aquatica]|uniref:ATP-dependent endonuclease n=1 Tax=Flavivirga aquatica TaxID=1849968 RepID=A0A1E5T7I8_9FLAO|nr:ATP-dependent endonuclease [Flavivirga aquatica]OEK07342.1 ATP-dependent endonuclease [Flavivirga aquatica]
MHINKVVIQNFRLLKNSTLELEKEKKKDLSLLIGRNNSGKTSFIVLFEKFLKNKSSNFSFDDFSLDLRKKLLDFNDETNEFDLSIKLIIEISYTKEDSLENISDLILDLDPSMNIVKVLFECIVDKKFLLEELTKIKDGKEQFVKKNISSFLNVNTYVFSEDSDLQKENRNNLIKKDNKTIDRLINFQVIHARREVTSSESGQGAKKVLSNLTTTYFNRENKTLPDQLDVINSSIIDMDRTLNDNYSTYFNDFLNNAKEFLDLDDLKVISDLQSKEILSNHSRVVYGSDQDNLPEHLNGLGYMNILYLLLNLEIKKHYFLEHKKEINLLFIEEPEAHTHPQMQYIFIDKVKNVLSGIKNLQTFISTHSAHIVKNSNFEDIRYFKRDKTHKNIEIKNFYSDLKKKYHDDDPDKDKAEKAHFKFLNQYLSIASSELFFAEKIIFIEGTTEKLLLPYFIDEYDKINKETPDYIKLSSQNISIIEVGANAKAFRHFLEFLDIKTLIITDIDTTKKTIKPSEEDKEKISYPSSSVAEGSHTSNYTLKYYLKAPEYINKEEFKIWFDKLKKDNLQDDSSIIKVSYQIDENGYHARSFEDAFIATNIDVIKENKEALEGLQKIEQLDVLSNFYDLTEQILKPKGKSEFASSILWLALSEDVEWNIPLYIKQGLAWIAKK